MKRIPECCGFPLWVRTKGISFRRSKKITKRRFGYGKFGEDWAQDLKVGSYVNACSYFNVKIAEIKPYYRKLQYNLKSLWEIDFIDTKGEFHSFDGCCNQAMTRDKIEKILIEGYKEDIEDDGASSWYGEEYPEYKEKALKIIAVLEAGGHICDENGCKL